MTICFFVTEVAGLINKNPYQDQDEQIHCFMNRIIDKQRKTPIDIPKRYNRMIEKNINETEIKKVQKKILDIKNLKCSDEIKQEIKKQIYTKRGIKYEDHAIEDYQNDIDLHIQTPKEFIKRFFIKNDVSFLIGGRIDGMVIDNQGDTIVIEVKNRQQKVFEVIPDYEKIQLECYLRMMRSDKCIFIERYDHQNHIKEYFQDDLLWNEILLSLSVIARNIQSLKESDKHVGKK
jgi:hypothetical protein